MLKTIFFPICFSHELPTLGTEGAPGERSFIDVDGGVSEKSLGGCQASSSFGYRNHFYPFEILSFTLHLSEPKIQRENTPSSLQNGP